jgi:hypothetical protein
MRVNGHWKQGIDLYSLAGHVLRDISQKCFGRKDMQSGDLWRRVVRMRAAREKHCSYTDQQ